MARCEARMDATRSGNDSSRHRCSYLLDGTGSCNHAVNVFKSTRGRRVRPGFRVGLSMVQP